MKIMTVVGEEAPANFVPAAAVNTKGLALFGITGRKASVGRLDVSVVKAQSLTLELPLKLSSWNLRGIAGIPNVGGETVDIGGTPVAKAAIWMSIDTEARKRGDQTGLDTLVVHAVNDDC